jgi:ATP-dependent Lon protease
MQDPLNASYPVLPLRDIVVFPHMIVPLFVGREKSVRALEEVMADDKQILLSSQIDPAVDDPDADGIYRAGVLANVLQLLKASCASESPSFSTMTTISRPAPRR